MPPVIELVGKTKAMFATNRKTTKKNEDRWENKFKTHKIYRIIQTIINTTIFENETNLNVVSQANNRSSVTYGSRSEVNWTY